MVGPVERLGSELRWSGGAKDRASAAAGEEEPARTPVKKLAVSWSYVLSKNWKMGIAYLVRIDWVPNLLDKPPTFSSTFLIFLRIFLFFSIFLCRDCGKQVYLGMENGAYNLFVSLYEIVNLLIFLFYFFGWLFVCFA